MLRIDDAAMQQRQWYATTQQNKHGGSQRKTNNWKYKHHFELIWSKSKNIVFHCTLCAGNKSENIHIELHNQ